MICVEISQAHNQILSDMYRRTYIEPPVRNHPKCKDSVVACGRWSFTRIEPQGVSSGKRSRHIYFMDDNLLHAMSKLGYVKFHVVTKGPLIF